MNVKALWGVVRRHKWKMIGGYVVSTATVYAIATRQRGAPDTPTHCHVDPATREFQGTPTPATAAQHAHTTRQHVGSSSDVDTFDSMAKDYDRDTGMDELVMGLPLLRRALMRHAKGRVLEVSCGTGRNLPYLCKSRDVEEVTVTDVSPAMLGIASTKVTEAGLSGRKPLIFRRMDATNLSFRDGSFDTVIDTFGLCSCDRPVHALREMARVCKPADAGGRILLLEHGKSPYGWLTAILDKHAPRHAARWGCWWNRDIEALVAKAGLVVETSRRFHFGTSKYIIARPPGRSSVNSEHRANSS